MLDNYDCFLCAVGYEKRCVHIAKKMAERVGEARFAIRFRRDEQLSFDENVDYFIGQGFQVIEDINEVNCLDRSEAIALDVSCMSRLMIARCLEAVREASRGRTIGLDVLYATSAFQGSPDDPPVISDISPITHGMSGRLKGSSRPILSVIGLGYEPERAAAILETMGPCGVVVFAPASTDQQFDEAVDRANNQLYGDDVDVPRYRYRVSDPQEAMRMINSVVLRYADEFRVVLLPLGPKIFATACMLTCIKSDGACSVWYPHSGFKAQLVDREASGERIGISCFFEDGVLRVDSYR